MKFFFVAGEASGDLHTANLVKALATKDVHLQLRGWGGEKMKQAGVQLTKHYKDLALMGFLEIVSKLPTVFRNLKLACDEIIRWEADAVVLVDFSGFNLRLAKKLRKKGYSGKIFYYISPKLWVWNHKRVELFKSYIDHVFCILPFEVDFYKKNNYPSATYIGNPLMDEIEAFRPNTQFLHEQSLLQKPIISLLPGSRKNEIQSVFPRMLTVVNDFPEYQFVVAGVESVKEYIEEQLEKAGVALPVVYDQTYDLVCVSSLSLVTSGTATLETALLNTPLILCYSGNPISFAIAKYVVTIDYIGLPNLIVKKEMVKELIQTNLTREHLLLEMTALLKDEQRRVTFFNDVKKLQTEVGSAGASNRGANKMIELLRS